MNDHLANAIDWLDAYRLGDIEAILSMYADDAVIECGCNGAQTISGAKSLRAYWVKRLAEHPATELDDLRPSADGATVTYLTRGGVVGAVLEFDRNGKIAFVRCGPTG